MPSLSLYPAIDIIYELSIYVAEVLSAQIVLALPSRLKSSEIELALAFYQSMRADFHIVWCQSPPHDDGNIEQLLMAHDDYMLGQGQPAGAFYLSNDKGRDWAGKRLWTESRQIKYTCEANGRSCVIVPQLESILSESRVPVYISDVTKFMEDGEKWYTGVLTIYFRRKEYGFIKIPSGISLRFKWRQCDGILKWELDDRRSSPDDRPVMVYVIPENEHPIHKVAALTIPDHFFSHQ